MSAFFLHYGLSFSWVSPRDLHEDIEHYIDHEWHFGSGLSDTSPGHTRLYQNILQYTLYSLLETSCVDSPAE